MKRKKSFRWILEASIHDGAAYGLGSPEVLPGSQPQPGEPIGPRNRSLARPNAPAIEPGSCKSLPKFSHQGLIPTGKEKKQKTNAPLHGGHSLSPIIKFAIPCSNETIARNKSMCQTSADKSRAVKVAVKKQASNGHARRAVVQGRGGGGGRGGNGLKKTTRSGNPCDGTLHVPQGPYARNVVLSVLSLLCRAYHFSTCLSVILNLRARIICTMRRRRSPQVEPNYPPKYLPS